MFAFIESIQCSTQRIQRTYVHKTAHVGSQHACGLHPSHVHVASARRRCLYTTITKHMRRQTMKARSRQAVLARGDLDRISKGAGAANAGGGRVQ